MTKIRRKGVAIVESEKGILVVAGKRKIFSLPAGGAERNESRKTATIRELREETGLKTKSSKYLFSYKGRKWRDHKGRSVRNHAKVFLIKAHGRLRPRKEIKYVTWYNPKTQVKVSKSTKSLIERYLKSKEFNFE